MAKNRRQYIVLRFHQADRHIVQAQEDLASVRVTLLKSHPQDSLVILKILVCLDAARDGIREVAMPKFTATPRDLLKEGDLDIIVANAKPLPDPHYASQELEQERKQPARSYEHRKVLALARKARQK